jgi:hypothetical protein
VLLGLTQPQVLSVVMIAAGSAWLLVLRRAPQPAPPATAARQRA